MANTSPRSRVLAQQSSKIPVKPETVTVNHCQRPLHKSFDAGNDHGAIVKIPKVMKSHQTDNPDCSLCKDWEQERSRKVASLYCHVCNIYLCVACGRRHRSVYKTKHFISAVALSPTHAASCVRMNGYHSVVCSEEGHKDVPKYFCETCEDIVCLECIEKYHDRHHFLYVKDAYIKHKASLDGHVEKAHREASHISKQIDQDASVLSELESKKEDVARKIKKHASALMEAIRTQEEELLHDLDRMFALKEEPVSRNKERCQNHLELINRTCRFTEKVMKDTSEVQVLVFKKYAIKRLEEVSRPEILRIESDDVNLNYFVVKRSPEYAKRLLGQLVDSPICPSNCVAHGDGLSRAIVGQETRFIVTARDKNNQPLSSGGNDVHVRISSNQEERIVPRVVDQGDGEYLVTYTTKCTGEITISVRIYDQPIRQSEYKVAAICQRDYEKITEPFLVINGLTHSQRDDAFKLPCGVAVDGKGRIFIADCHNHRIKIMNREGKSIKSFGGFGSKNGQLSNPTDVVISQDGKVYVCDKDNNRVQCFTLQGVFLAKFCFGDRKMKRPWGLCIDSAGNILVVDTRNNCVQVFTEDGTFVKCFGQEGSLAGQFHQPYFATCHRNGNIFITDNGNHRVQVFDHMYSYMFQFGNDGGELALRNPTGITVDHQGNVIVADQCNSRLQVFRANGMRVTVVAEPLNDPDCPSYPKGIEVTQDGHIIVADSDNDRVLLL